MPRELSANVRLAVIDMSGTTFLDNGALERAFFKTVEDLGMDHDAVRLAGLPGFLRHSLGQSPVRMFQNLFREDAPTALRAARLFEHHVQRALISGGVQPVPGAQESITRLTEAGVKVCLVTGHNRHCQNIVLDSLGWMGLADLSLCPSDTGRGRPYPDMILTAVLALDIDDVREVMVVGDTTADMQAGCRSGAGLKLGVLTGAHRTRELQKAGADLVVDSVRAVPDVLRLPAARTQRTGTQPGLLLGEGADGGVGSLTRADLTLGWEGAFQ